ncbi:MAG: phosphatase PAP2 family protein [Bacteroidia bacterium]|nr:phosphatase PAP2 family protein [Bacteroidia bacterium]
MRAKIAIFFFLFIASSQSENAVSAQNVDLVKNREAVIMGSNLMWTGLNYTLQFRSPKIPITGRTWTAGWIDRSAKTSYNSKAAKISDVTLLTTGVLCGISLLDKNQSAVFKKGMITAQSAWISANFAHSIKMIAKRNRPYTQAAGFQYSKRDDVYSFFSGHSAIAGSLVASAWLMRNGTGSLKGHNIWLGAAAATGASTLYLRFYAGKHYPSDILVGLISGIGIAYINYRIHEQ